MKKYYENTKKRQKLLKVARYVLVIWLELATKVSSISLTERRM